MSVSRLTLRGNWAACPTVIGPFVCEGVVGVGGCQWFGVLESCAVVRGGVWSYLASRGRTLEGF